MAMYSASSFKDHHTFQGIPSSLEKKFSGAHYPSIQQDITLGFFDGAAQQDITLDFFDGAALVKVCGGGGLIRWSDNRSI